MTALGKDFGEPDAEKQYNATQDLAEKAIAGIGPRSALPVTDNADVVDSLLGYIFDLEWYNKRFNDVKSNWQILLERARALQIPVITHSYCYPLFNENPTTLFGTGKVPRTGPWFNPRFREAQIMDRRVRKVCLKCLVDHFMGHILEPFRQQYKTFDPATQAWDYPFDFVDVRNANSSVDKWRDEMHLYGLGFREVSKGLHKLISSRFPQFFDPLSE